MIHYLLDNLNWYNLLSCMVSWRALTPQRLDIPLGVVVSTLALASSSSFMKVVTATEMAAISLD